MGTIRRCGTLSQAADSDHLEKTSKASRCSKQAFRFLWLTSNMNKFTVFQKKSLFLGQERVFEILLS
jgi:hypothetical protein